jgi:hypothetical protein
MPTIQNRLLPFRQYSEHDVINMFSLNGTGVAGTFVALESNDPENTDGWTTQSVGASFAGVTSFRYEVKSKVKVAPSGSTKYNVLGCILNDVLETDENGLLLKFNPLRKAELQAVTSGEMVPVLTNGIVTLHSAAYLGTPTVGCVGVIDVSGNGKVRAIDPTTAAPSLFSATGTYKPDQVIGKFISSAGTTHGGFALFKIEL